MSLLLSQKLDLGQSCNTIFLRSNKIHELWAIEFWLVLDNEKKERILCSRLLKGLIPVFKNVGKGLQRKTTALLVFLLWLVWFLKNL